MSYLAEQNVIGALLIEQDSIKKVYGKLDPEMFTSDILSRAYMEFLRGYENGYTVNIVVLDEKMSDMKIQQHIILDELKECIKNTVSSVEIVSAADIIVCEYRTKRYNNILDRIILYPDTADSQIAKIITEFESVLNRKNSVSKTLAEITKENKEKYFCDNEEEKLYLGFPNLDDMLGGLEGGDMIVIGARPAVGKSAFVTQITNNLAKKGKKVGFYNLEMQEKQVYERFVVAKSGIGLTRLRRAVRFLNDEEKRFRYANEELEKQDNIIISTGGKSMSDIKHESRHMGYDVIIIDYLQLIRSDSHYSGNRYAEVGAISKAIKDLAMSLNIPVIALSQLNRVSEARETKEPTMSELREAGDIEQDASVIMLMWNLSDSDRSKKGFKVEKQRQGRTGKMVLKFDGDMMHFEESDESIKDAKEWADKVDDDCPF